ncbi:radical SAM protein [Clostridium sp. 19966]|uniref:B12-binding domain-containing radical SAM protein n=1 Tax=Clostridium sp. 19966 TaxID=2768166 RepID=UPI0028DDE823|nr:radical SAM protein [Clostridium sp. 19966]MDT8717347.1 radical SAM protein [Clostridium sp. 19966]
MFDVSIVNASFSVKNPYIPIGPLIVVSKLEEQGLKVEFKDYQLIKSEASDPKSISELLLELKSKIICIGVFANYLPLILKAVDILKETNPELIIVLAGPGVAKISDEIFNLSRIDIVIRGEGEITTPLLVKKLISNSSLSEIEGISYRCKNKIIHNADRQNLKCIDVYPSYNHIELKDYDNKATIITSRGCAYNCMFCSKPIWEKGVVYRSLENVFEEIKQLKFKVNRIYFCDDAFIVNKKRLFEFCRIYKELNINIPWECTGRVGCMDEELLEVIRSAGCDTLYVGIESGSNVVLEKLNKKISIEQAREEVNLAKRYMKRIYTSYIWGFPFETLEDFNQTIFNYLSDSIDHNLRPVLNLATPFIASKLYDEYKDKLAFMEDNIYNGSTINMDYTKDYEDVKEFIIENKKIFSSFFYIEHQAFYDKKKIVDKLLNRYKEKDYV